MIWSAPATDLVWRSYCLDVAMLARGGSNLRIHLHTNNTILAKLARPMISGYEIDAIDVARSTQSDGANMCFCDETESLVGRRILATSRDA